MFTLYSKGEKEVWKNTQIFNGMGVIEAKNQYIASVCGQEIKELMESSKRSQEQLSDNQQRKILERLKKVSNNMVPSSIMRKFIYKSGRTQSAQGRETCP